jgi:hypothetical protein
MTAVAFATFLNRSATALDAAGYEHRLTLDEAADHPGPRPASPSGARRVSHAQLCRVMGARARSECAIAALVFPRITEEPGEFALRRLDRDEVVARLEGALFGARAGRSTSDVFVLPWDPPPPDGADIAERCRALADRVPGWSADRARTQPSVRAAMIWWRRCSRASEPLDASE